MTMPVGWVKSQKASFPDEELQIRGIIGLPRMNTLIGYIIPSD